jgi:hypothetical protein
LPPLVGNSEPQPVKQVVQATVAAAGPDVVESESPALEEDGDSGGMDLHDNNEEQAESSKSKRNRVARERMQKKRALEKTFESRVKKTARLDQQSKQKAESRKNLRASTKGLEQQTVSYTKMPRTQCGTGSASARRRALKCLLPGVYNTFPER